MKKALAHPLIAGTAWILAIFAFAWVMLALFNLRAYPGIILHEHSNRIAIFRQGETNTLAVTSRGRPIEQSVIGLDVSVWNQGSAPVRRSDFSTPILLKLDGQILEAKISGQSSDSIRPNVDLAGVEKGELALTWDLLRRNEGLTLRVIYAGAPTAPLTLSGPANHKPPWFILTPEKARDEALSLSRTGTALLFMAALFMLLAPCFALAWLALDKGTGPRWLARFSPVILLVLCAALIITLRRSATQSNAYELAEHVHPEVKTVMPVNQSTHVN
jgi:hypothetical protein